MNSIIKKIHSMSIVGLSSFLSYTRYLVGVINTNLVGCVAIIATPSTPSVNVLKNCGIDLP